MEWRPIETAPKDKVLCLWVPALGLVPNCRYREQGTDDPLFCGGWFNDGYPWGSQWEKREATHWMEIVPPDLCNSDDT